MPLWDDIEEKKDKRNEQIDIKKENSSQVVNKEKIKSTQENKPKTVSTKNEEINEVQEKTYIELLFNYFNLFHNSQLKDDKELQKELFKQIANNEFENRELLNLFEIFHNSQLKDDKELQKKLFKQVANNEFENRELLNLFELFHNSQLKDDKELQKELFKQIANENSINIELLNLFDMFYFSQVSKNQQLQERIFKEIANKVKNREDIDSLIELFIDESDLLPDSQNKYLRNPFYGIEFIANILRKNSKEITYFEKSFNKFNNLLKFDFLYFLNSIALKNSTQLYQQLLDIRDELEEDIKFQELLDKTVIGIGGSFSAGKSSFLNSILETNEDILPVETTPTTSIPTYIVKSSKDGIYTFNKEGEKSKINKDGLLAISHEFKNIYDFGLISILQKIIIDSKKMPYENIAFLDTPGYSKADGKEQTDREIAKSHLKNLNALIWLIDIDNGTIKNSDIEFIKSLKLNQDIEILFIFNKADKKPQKDIQNILQLSKETLQKEIKNSFEVTAYSSHNKEEFVLQEKNKHKGIKIIKKADRIPFFINKYNNKNSKRFFNRIKNALDSFGNNLLEEKIKNQKNIKLFNKLDTFALDVDIEVIKDFGKIVKSNLNISKKAITDFEQIKKKLLDSLEVFKNEGDFKNDK